MAREKKERQPEGMPAWLITFSDLMTLLLTFFVLLVSMSVIDERYKLEVLGSVARQFGVGETFLNPTAPAGKLNVQEPGKMDLPAEDLELLRDKIFDDSTKDLNFQENKYVQIFSINSEVLFREGATQLSDKGITLLDKLVPYLLEIPYPLMVAGHTTTLRDEESQNYVVSFNKLVLDASWMLSLRRAMAVYSHFSLRGMSPARLSMEGFGQFRPKASNNTPEGRAANRRVDLVLDKRNLEWAKKVDRLRENAPPEQTDLYFKGFRFDLTMPGQNTTPGVPQNVLPTRP